MKDLVKEESEKLRQAAEEVGVMHDMRKYWFTEQAQRRLEWPS